MKTTKTRPTAAPTVALTLEINGTAYALRPLACTEHKDVAWRVTKADGAAYEVSSAWDGPTLCSCPAFRWRHADAGPHDAGCKHIRALRALELV